MHRGDEECESARLAVTIDWSDCNNRGYMGREEKLRNFRRVDLVSVKADNFGRRHVYSSAQHQQETPFVFDKYYDSPEAFLIPFRASFYFNEDGVEVQQLCSMGGGGETVAGTDDGMSQEVVIKRASSRRLRSGGRPTACR